MFLCYRKVESQRVRVRRTVQGHPRHPGAGRAGATGPGAGRQSHLGPGGTDHDALLAAHALYRAEGGSTHGGEHDGSRRGLKRK